MCRVLITTAIVGLIALGLFPTTSLAQYRFDNWTTDEGLPQNTVSAILQTRDGYLWLATAGGLVRFDGLRFTVFEVEFPRDFRGCVKSRDTTGFSRVEFQFLTNKNRLADADTTDFSRVEFQFLPNATLPPKGRN